MQLKDGRRGVIRSDQSGECVAAAFFSLMQPLFDGKLINVKHSRLSCEISKGFANKWCRNLVVVFAHCV